MIPRQEVQNTARVSMRRFYGERSDIAYHIVKSSTKAARCGARLSTRHAGSS